MENNVVVYSKSNCIQCKFTKNFLEDEGIDYVEIDVEKDEQAIEEVKSMGYMSMPVVVVNGVDSWSGFQPDKLDAIKKGWVYLKIVYFSNTGQTRKFVNKLKYDYLELNFSNPFQIVDEDFIIIAPSYEKEATEIIDDFVETGDNIKYCKGVVGSGNRNFADLFCFTAKDFAVEHDIPYLYEFEFQGMDKDVENLTEIINRIYNNEVFKTPRELGYFGIPKGEYKKGEIEVREESFNWHYIL